MDLINNSMGFLRNKKYTKKIVTVFEENQRIDKTLSKWSTHTNSVIQKLIRKKLIYLNGSVVINPGYRLKLNDNIFFPINNSSNIKEKSIPTKNLIKKTLSKINIIFEDQDILVIEKLLSYPVHSGTKYKFGIIDILRAKKTEWNNLELAHRIDKCTTGLLLLTKNPISTRELHKQFKYREIKKNYIALVHNITEDKFISFTNLKRENKENHSITHFKLIKRIKDKCSLIEAEPITGRNHQIRRHLQIKGYPIICDLFYENYSYRGLEYRYLAKNLLPDKDIIYLHAIKLEFNHPTNNKKLSFYSRLPEYWNKCITLLEN